MNSLDSGLFLILDAEGRSEEWISFGLELVLVVGRVEEEVSEQINSLVKLAGLESEGVGGGLSGWGDSNISSQEIQFLLDLFSGSLLGSSEVQLAQKLDGSGSLKSFLSGSSLDKNL